MVAPGAVANPDPHQDGAPEALVLLADIDSTDRSFHLGLPERDRDLRASLAAEGQRVPVDLLPGPPCRILDGYRRVAAARELGWRSVRAVVHTGLADEDAFRLAFLRNVVDRKLAPMERAGALGRACRRGVAKAALARWCRLSEKQVGRYLELLDLPPAVQAILDGKVITMAAARLLAQAQVADPAAWKLRIESERLAARELRRALRGEGRLRARGRPRTYLRCEEDQLRMYAWVLRRDASPVELQRAREALEDALRWLAGDPGAEIANSCGPGED